MMAATSVLTKPVAEEVRPAGAIDPTRAGKTASAGGRRGATDGTNEVIAGSEAAEATKTPGATATPGVRKAVDAADGSDPSEAFITSELSERAAGTDLGERDDAESDERRPTRSGRGYHGRRRRS
jgi:hypothetical protein